MPRRARVTMTDCPHHVYQKGITGRPLFASDKDFKAYLTILAEQARKYGTDILAYCLMKDRVNIVAIPRKKGSLAKTIGRTHFSYAQYVNHSNKRKGQVWRDRFQSCMLDDDYMEIAVQYVECQPVFDKKARKAEAYGWSSAKAHISGKDEYGVLALGVWPPKRARTGWSKKLAGKIDDATRAKLRVYSQTGRPLGGDAFVARLEKKLKKRLRAMPVGRPPKK